MIVETPILLPTEGAVLSALIVRAVDRSGTRQIGVVVTGSWLTVKEQMPLLYARRLAALGYAALVFDFAGFGESGGQPRQAEIPARKIADMCAVAAFLSSLSFIEPGRIGHVAVCASAQYAQHAIARGAPIAAFASIAGWYHDAETIAPFYGGREGVERRLRSAAQDVAAFLRCDARANAPAYAPGDERAGMHFKLDYYADPERGAIPAWKNEMAPMSWAHWLSFDGLSVAPSNNIPSLMVHGPGCALPENAKRVYDAWTGPKRLEWAEGEQTDFYDQPEQAGLAVGAIDEWFKVNLAGPSRAQSVPAGPAMRTH
jgi:dienelactone hydrolase